jgi:hypothetical protein
LNSVWQDVGRLDSLHKVSCSVTGKGLLTKDFLKAESCFKRRQNVVKFLIAPMLLCASLSYIGQFDDL